MFPCPLTMVLIISLACWPMTRMRQKLPGACMVVCSWMMLVAIFHLEFDVRVTMWGCDGLGCHVLFHWSVWITHGHYSEKSDLPIRCGFLVCITEKEAHLRGNAEATYWELLLNKPAFVSQTSWWQSSNSCWHVSLEYESDTTSLS